MRAMIRAILIFLVLTMASCQWIGMRFMGIHRPKKLSNIQIQAYHNKLHLSKDSAYQFKEHFLDSFISRADSNDHFYKDLLQPLSYQVYDSTGNLISMVINCYAYDPENKRKLNFNVNHKMEVFPPVSDVKIKRSFQLNDILSFTNYPFRIEPKSHYTVLVIYNKFMDRQTVEFTKAVKINKSIIPKNRNVRFIYINNDNTFVNQGF